MKCGLCGIEFDEMSAHAACGGCGFVNPVRHIASRCGMSNGVKGCNLVKCPNCGFEDVRTPLWLKRLFGKKTNAEVRPQAEREQVPLDELNVNRTARVSHLKTEDRSALHKLMAIGALPETEITLIQKFPSYVLQIGRSQYCIDRELASCIMTERR